MRRARPPRWSAGFTLLETMVAIAILGVAMVGSLGGLVSASEQLRNGQIRQYRAELVDASVQRWMLANKGPGSAFAKLQQPIATCAGPCQNVAIGAAPSDPTQIGAAFKLGDISTGAYFLVKTDGEITQLNAGTTPAVADGTPCGSAGLPIGSYCREVLITGSSAATGGVTGPVVTTATKAWGAAWPPAVPNALNAGATVYTVWVRVSRQGDTLAQATGSTTTFIQ